MISMDNCLFVKILTWERDRGICPTPFFCFLFERFLFLFFLFLFFLSLGWIIFFILLVDAWFYKINERWDVGFVDIYKCCMERSQRRFSKWRYVIQYESWNLFFFFFVLTICELLKFCMHVLRSSEFWNN